MKIRIRGNSIRYRLTRSEVEAFANNHAITEKTCFATGDLTFKLLRTDEPAMYADMTGSMVSVFVPTALANSWAGTAQVSLKEEMKISSDVNLQLLVEKDFQCLDRTEEDQSDYFENPMKTC